MNCLEFGSQVEILARGALADARLRAGAEAHVESCRACAARLADERALSVGLRALAAGMRTAEAPARAELALVAAFRTRAAGTAGEESSDTPAEREVGPVSGPAPVRRWSWAKTCVAASLAAAASLALFVLVRPTALPPPPPQQQRALNEPRAAGGGALSAFTPDTSAKSFDGAGPVNAPEEFERTPRAPNAPRPRALNVAYSANARRSRPAPAPAASAPEVATDFIPLVHAGPYTPAEDGHLVRVELPRAALASFGLPVNAEVPGGSVKADVLLGQDGIARAIRFVR